MDKKDYKKFGGRIGNLTSNSFIWLAGDHMLVCEDSQFIEKYKRFYFKDIQALIVKRTINSLITSIVLFILTAGSLWFLAHARKGWNIFWEILAGIEFFILMVNIVKGQSCLTYIQTAVQKERLKGIKRVKRVEKLLKSIGPLIRSFQGEIDPQLFEAQYEGLLEKAQKAQALQPPPIEQDSLLHTVLFFVFLIWSLLVGAVYLYSNVVIYIVILVIYAILAILSIMAVVKQTRIKIKPAIRNWTWGALVVMVVSLILGYFTLCFAIGFTSTRASHDVDPYSMTMDILKYIPDNHVIRTIILIVFYTSLLIGIVGVFLSARPRGVDKPSV